MALDVPPGVQLLGSNINAELVANDNDVQRSSAISIKTFNKIIDDVTSTSPVLIEIEEEEKVLVSSIVSTALSLILQTSALSCYYYFATSILLYYIFRQDWESLIQMFTLQTTSQASHRLWGKSPIHLFYAVMTIIS